MKVILENNIGSVEASSENASFPATNLLDEHPKSKFKAASNSVSSVIITAYVTGGATAVGMVGITADAAIVTISDPNAAAWEAGTAWETGTAWSATVPDMEIEEQFVEGDENTLWVDFSEFFSNAQILVTLNQSASADTVLAAGVIVAGGVIDVPNPGYGFEVSQRDYSISEELSNGSLWYKKRDIVKTVAGEVLVTLAQYRQMLIGFKAIGRAPTMWNVIDDYTGDELVLFGRLSEMPRYSMVSTSSARASLSITEVL